MINRPAGRETLLISQLRVGSTKTMWSKFLDIKFSIVM